MAPELVAASRISRASDVYSFGVLLLELVHGASALALWEAAAAALLTAAELGHQAPGFTAGARGAVSPRLVLLLDSLPREGADAGCPVGQSVLELAEACVAPDPARRPTLDQVAEALVLVLEALGGSDAGRIGAAAAAAGAAAGEAAAVAAVEAGAIHSTAAGGNSGTRDS